MENSGKLKNIVEALLIVSESGLSREEIKKAIGTVDVADIDAAINSLKEEYSQEIRAFNIAEIAGRCRIVSKPEYMPWITKLYEIEPARITGPSLETLAIIAYKQPVTRAEIEAVRGVNVGGVLKTLLEKDLVRVAGRKDVPGKPLTYGTTEKFLELFGLNSLHDLPMLREFTEEDLDFGKQDESQIVPMNDGGENENGGDEDQTTVMEETANAEGSVSEQDAAPKNEEVKNEE